MKILHPHKLALGLFHFNPHWGADPICTQRHCTEGLGPFLKVVEAHPDWKLSLEISGSGLEILAKHYKKPFDRLGSLVKSGQLELISSLYTPSLWVAFPRHDLVRSIEENLEVLKRYDLPSNRIFFAQEAFFGEGVRRLKEYFDVAVCKDDYLDYFYEIDYQHPVWKLGDLRVVVASGHLLCESVSVMRNDPCFLRNSGLSYRHQSYLDSVKVLNEQVNFPNRTGSSESVIWHWYHCGDGNHFCTISKPWNHEMSFFDEAWTRWNEELLARLQSIGYEFSFVRGLCDAVEPGSDQPLPPLIEGSWNSRESGGVARWMGRHSNPWENDNRILTCTARARSRLIDAERRIRLANDTDLEIQWDKRVKQAWREILTAECSDYLGWSPSPTGMATAFQSVELALKHASEIYDEFAPNHVKDTTRHRVLPSDRPPTCFTSSPIIFGAVGDGGWNQLYQDCWMWEVRFRSTERECGVRFLLSCDHLEFSPSGDEMRLMQIPLNLLKPSTVSLPLANGLIKLDHECYLIKNLAYIHIAAEVRKDPQTITFSVNGDPQGHEHAWTFYLVKGSSDRALTIANAINYCDYQGKSRIKHENSM